MSEKQPPGEPVLEFRKYFWAARSEHIASGRNATTDAPKHREAMEFARQHKLQIDGLLQASLLDLQGRVLESLNLLQAIENIIPTALRGHRRFLLSCNLRNLERHDEAMAEADAALAEPHFDHPEYAWNNLGMSLDAKGEHDEAIKAYRKSAEALGNDRPGIAWHNLGTALSARRETDQAILAYRNALKSPSFERPGDTWNNLGVALHGNRKYEEAIEAFEKALESSGYDGLAMTWANLGHTYQARKQFEEAQKAFEEALKATDPHGSQHQRAQRGLELLKSKMRPAALKPEDRALVEKPTSSPKENFPEARLVAKIREAGGTKYDDYLKKKSSERGDVLTILRGWSSAVTLLEGSERRWRGGGYFLKWRTCGIVIDPGFDFLRNFHDAGYHGREISAVLVSHNHPDHNDDLKPIDDLRYELYVRRKDDKYGGVQPYLLLWDEDTHTTTTFQVEKPEHQHPPVNYHLGFKKPMDLTDHDCKLPFRVTAFRVRHSEDVPNAMGMVIELLDEKGAVALRIGYTGDTEYFEQLASHLANCDILIAHISQPRTDELEDPTKFKKAHLGYHGTAKLLKECQPKLALIGEFWAGFTDLRIDLVKGLRVRSGCQQVFPAGLGLHLHLPEMKAECTQCRQQTLFTDLRVAPPPENFGDLAYLCSGCLLQ